MYPHVPIRWGAPTLGSTVAYTFLFKALTLPDNCWEVLCSRRTGAVSISFTASHGAWHSVGAQKIFVLWMDDCNIFQRWINEVAGFNECHRFAWEEDFIAWITSQVSQHWDIQCGPQWYFPFPMGGPWPASQDTGLCTPMPASGETIEAFWSAPSSRTLQWHAFSLPGSPAPGTGLQVPKEYIQSSFHRNKDGIVQAAPPPSPFLLSLPLSLFCISSQGILPFFLSWMQWQAPSGLHESLPYSKTAWALKSFCKGKTGWDWAGLDWAPIKLKTLTLCFSEAWKFWHHKYYQE